MNIESQLLMNIHKIEKAMSMPDRRPVFSQDIVKKLIHVLQEQYHEIDKDIINAAYETLSQYKLSLDTSIPENEEIIHFIYHAMPLLPSHLQTKNTIKNNNFDLLKSMAENRHSVRNFSHNKVDYKIIEKAIGIANTLPTPCNRQACSLMIIENEKVRTEILSLQQGNRGFSAPVLAAILVDKSAFTQDYEVYAPYFHAGSFASGLVLALESLQLSSCLLNWHVSSETNEEVKSLLNINKKEIAAFIYIGYSQENKKEAYSFKKNPQKLVEIYK